jgi:cytochrome c peroxidase
MSQQQELLEPLVAQQSGTAPRGVAPAVWDALVPSDNRANPARVSLGRKLFFDTRLSADGTVACATCHDVTRGFTDQRAVSEGIRDQLGRRNAPTVANAAFHQTQFWDGRAASLEDQAKLPIVNPIEMGRKNGDDVTKAIAGDPDYVTLFRAAYGRAPNYDDMGRALAVFERTLVFLDAPFDRFRAGDTTALADDAQKGWALFNGKARCAACHPLNDSSPIGSDGRFHNIGVSARTASFEEHATRALGVLAADPSQEAIDRLALETDMSELGRFLVTREYADVGAFKTEQLRNVGLTGPYMHDGSLRTLWDVMDHYNKGGETNPYLDGGIEPLALTDEEIDQVVAFLFTLTDYRFAQANATEEKKQRSLAASSRPMRDETLAKRKVFPFERRVFPAAPAGGSK